MTYMTLKELYAYIGGDYEQAMRVLRIDRLLDKHIRRFAQNGVIDELVAAGKAMDGTRLFESAHAAKGVCSNLGLTEIAGLASDIAEEFRPGNSRTMSDEEVAAKIDRVAELGAKVKDGIRQYETA